MLTIYFHGYLSELQPKPIQVFAETAREALSALSRYAGFNPRKGDRHTVTIDGIHTLEALEEKTSLKELHLRPVVLGAGGDGGFLQTVIGAVLVALSFIPGFQFLLPVGLSMMLGGVLQMLMPQPKLDGMDEGQLKSQYLGARGNTVAIGTTIPMIFGRHKAWGHYLSFDVDSADLNSAPEEWYSSTFTDFGELTYSAAPEEIPSLDPQEEVGIPTATFSGVNDTQLAFTPAIDLPQGQLNVTFNTGRSLNCFNSVSGVVDYVTIQGGYLDDLPPVGTPIIFSQNYV